jgi:hypothetical protein
MQVEDESSSDDRSVRAPIEIRPLIASDVWSAILAALVSSPEKRPCGHMPKVGWGDAP